MLCDAPTDPPGCTPHWTMSHTIRLPLPAPLWIGFLFATAAGCSHGGVGNGEDVGALEFVRLEHGGLCATGPCRVEVTVGDDGTWTASGTSPTGPDRGRVEPGAASRLAAVLEEHWEALTTAPFQGTCPTAYDGQETVYVVRRAGGEGAEAGDEEVLRELPSCTWDLERPEAARALERLEETWRQLGLPR